MNRALSYFVEGHIKVRERGGRVGQVQLNYLMITMIIQNQILTLKIIKNQLKGKIGF